MRKSILLPVLLGLFFVSTAVAVEPGDTLWTRIYGGWLSEHGHCVRQTLDGGYILTGYTGSFEPIGGNVWLMKTDANGDSVWTRVFGGDSEDIGWHVQQTADSGYVVGGRTASFGAGLSDMYLIKTEPNGDTLRGGRNLGTRTYGGPDWEGCYLAQQTTDGGYVMAGRTRSFGMGGFDFYVVKTDHRGDVIWERTYGGTADDKAFSIQQTPDGGYIIAGDTKSFGVGGAIWLIKADANGDTLWTRTYGGISNDEASCVQMTTDGGYIIFGETYSFGAGGADFYMVKTDANGDTVWTRTHGGTDHELLSEGQQTSDGGYVMVGYTMSFGAGKKDIYVVKTDANGDTMWKRTYGGWDYEYGNSIHQTDDGSYVVLGYTGSFTNNADWWFLKIAGEHIGPDVSIEIIPDDPPVTVPQGGSFGYTGTITNNTEDPQTTDIWVMAVGPTKEVYGPFKEFQDVPLGSSQARSRHLSQRVANVASLGFYDYIAYCGDYPSTVMDSSFFQIEVVEGVGSSQAGWVLTGSFLEGDLADLPSEFALLSNYPNPFNASTAISYELPTDTHVKLEIYNLFGQKLATVVDGQQEAGYRSVTWEDSEVASGVYFYKLTAGDYTEIKTMTLLR